MQSSRLNATDLRAEVPESPLCLGAGNPAGGGLHLPFVLSSQPRTAGMPFPQSELSVTVLTFSVLNRLSENGLWADSSRMRDGNDVYKVRKAAPMGIWLELRH